MVSDRPETQSSLYCNSPHCSQAAIKFYTRLLLRFNDLTIQRFGCGFAALRLSRLCGFFLATLVAWRRLRAVSRPISGTPDFDIASVWPGN